MKPKMREIILRSGIRVKIPLRFKYAKCKGCGADDIIWATTKNGKSMPVRWCTIGRDWISHFLDCSNASKFRKEK